MPNKSTEPVSKKTTKKSAKVWIRLVLIAILVIAIVGYLAWDIFTVGPLSRFLSNRDDLVGTIRGAGFWGPLIYVLLQFLQTVVAPIPGQIVGGVGGFIFGPWGILWTLVGSLLGWVVVLKLSRIFGRPLLEKLFKPDTIKQFDFVLEHRSAGVILLAILLIPGLPDDMICYIAGLTVIPIKKLLIIITLGRLPTIILTNYLGSGASDNLPLVIVLAFLTMIVLGICIWQREKILNFIKNPKTFIKEKAASKKAAKKTSK